MWVVQEVKIANTGALTDDCLGFFPHPLYTLDLDLAPSDFHLFTHLKQFWVAYTWMRVKKIVKKWFSGLAADFYNTGIQTLVT
jgi:hypothetical protein